MQYFVLLAALFAAFTIAAPVGSKTDAALLPRQTNNSGSTSTSTTNNSSLLPGLTGGLSPLLVGPMGEKSTNLGEQDLLQQVRMGKAQALPAHPSVVSHSEGGKFFSLRKADLRPRHHRLHQRSGCSRAKWFVQLQQLKWQW